MEWQPIDTAPKDGTTIEIFGPVRFANAPGYIAIAEWRSVGWYRDKWVTSTGQSADELGEGPPTHWRPFSKPTTEQE